MIYKLTSVKSVIAKVFADLELQEDVHRITDMMEWAGEALEKIGAFPYFINKVTGLNNQPLLVLSNYQVKLPHDFYSLIQAAYSPNSNGPFYPMRYSTGSFDGNGNSETITPLATTPAESDIITMAMSIYGLSYDDAVIYMNNYPEKRTIISSLITNAYDRNKSFDTTSGNPLATTDDYTYVISNGYMKTNISDGYIMLSYQAIPTDENGYPMIPDDISFKEAIYWYINMKMMYPKWCSGQVRDAVYYDAKRSWNYFCKQAYGDALMPNTDKLESIKNAWVRLVPEFHEHSSGFSTLGQEQYYYNHN